MKDLQYARRANVSRLTISGLAVSLAPSSVTGFASDVPRLSDQVNTGKILYLLTNGKWAVSKINPQDMREQETDNIKNSKTVCNVVRDEPVDGVSATLYKVHGERDGTESDSQIWTSKANGLPLRVKMEEPALDSHYSYSDVVAPNVH